MGIDLRQDVMRMAADLAERAESQRDGILRDTVSSYRMAVEGAEQLLPQGPQRYEYWLGLASGYQGALEIMGRHVRIPAAVATEIAQLDADHKRVSRIAMPERLEADHRRAAAMKSGATAGSAADKE